MIHGSFLQHSLNQTLVTLLQGISLATHANDGDLARLKKCVNEAAGKNIDGTLLSEASALLRRLSTEVCSAHWGYLPGDIHTPLFSRLSCTMYAKLVSIGKKKC